MTRVRLFASLREAAGTGQTSSHAPTVAALLIELGERYGEPFASRLATASVVVDGDPVARDSQRSLAATEEVALLPPFSGGASASRRCAG